MSVDNIKKAFKSFEGDLWRELTGSGGRKTAGQRFIYNIRIDPDTFKRKAVSSFNRAYQMATDTTDTPATEADITKVFNNTVSKWKKSTGLNGVTMKNLKGGGFGIRAEGTDMRSSNEFSDKVNGHFRKAIYDGWREEYVKDAPQGNEKGYGSKKEDDIYALVGGASGDITNKEGNLGFAHDKRSTAANATFLDWLKQNNSDVLPVVGQETEEIDVASWVMEQLGIGWERKYNKRTKELEWIVSGELAGDNPPDAIDDVISKQWEQKIDKAFEKLVNSPEFLAQNIDFKASPSYRQVIEQQTAGEIVNYYKKLSNAKIINPPKKVKSSKRSGKIKTAKRRKTIKKTRTRAKVATVSMRKERGKGRGASTQAIAELAKLKKYINSRLPAEVRRNMGRPALQNQTGRFSNSVQLLSLQQAQNTIMANYTYLLSPYATFENTGRKRWPLAYNPKTVIAKSIRNLAQGRIGNKLTLRRV